MKIVIVTGLLVGGILGVFYLAGFTAIAAGPPEPTLVMDINPITGSNPTWLTVLGDELYFVADDGEHGPELWKHDGSLTSLVKDISPAGTRLEPSHLIAFDGRLFFNANDGFSGQELWISNGTEAGTQLFKDIYTNPTESSNPTRFAISGSLLFFQANDGDHGYELWATDGTSDVIGTFMVQDIHEGPDSSSPTSMIDVNGTLYFVADDGVNGIELWKSDGTGPSRILSRISIQPVAQIH
jgi:ELWxxDGT repeat protein